MRPFRFGLSRTTADTSNDYIATAKRAEARGYDVLLCADHLGALSPVVALTAAAMATERVRVSGFVLNNDFRHPAIVAQETATIDLMTDGRYELALGAGWNVPEYTESGIAFDQAGVRIARLEEAVTILRRLFTGDEVTFNGDHYTITEHALVPQPPQGAALPIVIGGNGDRLLGVAARHASIIGLTGLSITPDSVGFEHFTAAGVRDRIDHVTAHAGDRAADLEFNALVQRIVVTGDRRKAAEELASEAADRYRLAPTAEDYLDSPFSLIGTVEQITEQLGEFRERLGITYFVVRADGSEEFDDVVETLAGT